MKLKQEYLLAIFLVLVLAVSVAAMVQRQKEAISTFSSLSVEQNEANFFAKQHDFAALSHLHNTMLVSPVISNVWSSVLVSEKEPLQENMTRSQIYSFIQANPGIQFRAICSGLGLSIGVVQFHLAVLEKNGFIRALFKGKYKRFFAAGKFTQKEMETIATLKLKTVRSIFKALLDGKHISHHELAAKLSISSQGLTWQMSRLQQTGLIQENRNKLSITYSISSAHTILIARAITSIEKT